VGVWLGRWGATRLDKATFERIIVAILAVTGALLIFT
jgi:uncharacterized membrane protein YfcA